MKQILEVNDYVKRLLGDQQIDPGAPLRPIVFCLTAPVEEGVLLYHTMTKELLLLSEEELKSLYGEDGPAEMRDYLIRHWFVVPEEHDDCALSDEVTTVACAVHAAEEAPGISHYTILTTTDCNARCFYCFEKGYEIMTMSEETARRVARYILRTKRKGKISIAWFGGEPLFNGRAIEIICEELNAAGCEYTSTITTNGYLFDRETVEKAARDWQIKSVSLTLDGTEEVYNRTKAYIYPDDPSPFRTVLGNIKRLLTAGIEVMIRLNVSTANIGNLEKLVDFLQQELAGYRGYTIYSRRLYQYGARLAAGGMEEFRLQHEALDAKLRREGMEKKHIDTVFSAVRVNQCSADNPRNIVICPDGSLTKCQHITQGPRIGVIGGQEWDEDRFCEWCEHYNPVPACAGCAAYPVCYRLRHCESTRAECTALDVREMLDYWRSQMKLAYQMSLSST